MSFNYIILIPTNPDYVPAKDAQQSALKVFASFVRPDAEIEAVVSDDVWFVDQGGNFEKVSCPVCSTTLADRWWLQAMDAAYEIQPSFSNLLTTVSCCGAPLSLNDLDYDWPAGFARFQLKALNPDTYEINDAQIAQLQSILGHQLRHIWPPY